MTNSTVEPINKAHIDAAAKGAAAAEHLTKTGTDNLITGSQETNAAFQELTKAYQELATENVRNLTAAIKSISTVKSPTEFINLQQKLIKEGVDSAVNASQHIAQLTTAVFTSAFEPLKKQIEAVQKNGRV